MRPYLKLVNFEFNRFAKLYLSLAAVIFIIQLITVVITANMYMSRIMELVRNGVGQGSILERYQPFGLYEVTNYFGFFLPIALGIMGLLFYMFFIWYRDWFSRTSFIYHLLTLPTARMNVFFAKITTVMLSVLGLISMQLIMMKVFEFIIKWIVPFNYRDDMNITQIINNSQYLWVFYPQGWVDFLVYYGAGASFVVIVFTMVLLERSFRFIGVLYSVLYFGGCVLVCLLPVFAQIIFDDYLYTTEFFFAEMFTTLIVVCISLLFSRYLMNKQITV